MQIYIPDTTPYTTIAQICALINHDWDKGRGRWACARCGKRRRAKTNSWRKA